MLQGLPPSVDWVEIDVRRSADGVPVVFHDETISTGERAGSLSYDFLSNLGVRSLRDFIQELPAAINVVLDVKNSIDDAASPHSRTTSRITAQAIKENISGHAILLTSFDPAIVMSFRRDSPLRAVGLTTWQGVPLRESIPTAAALNIDVLAVHIDALRPYGIELGDSRATLATHVDLAHEVGLQLACWGGKELSRSDVDYLAELGVDAIYMDEQNIWDMSHDATGARNDMTNDL